MNIHALVLKTEKNLEKLIKQKTYLNSKAMLKYQILLRICEKYVSPEIPDEINSFDQMEKMFKNIIENIPHKNF